MTHVMIDGELEVAAPDGRPIRVTYKGHYTPVAMPPQSSLDSEDFEATYSEVDIDISYDLPSTTMTGRIGRSRTAAEPSMDAMKRTIEELIRDSVTRDLASPPPPPKKSE